MSMNVNMNREVKIGLAIVGMLLLAFSVLLVRRLIAWERQIARMSEPPPAAQPAEQPQTAAPRDAGPTTSAWQSQDAAPLPLPTAADRMNDTNAVRSNEPSENPFRPRAVAEAESEIPDAAELPGPERPDVIADSAVRRASAEELLDPVEDSPEIALPSDPSGATDETAADSAPADVAQRQAAWRDDEGTGAITPVSDTSTDASSTDDAADRGGWRSSADVAPPQDGKYTVQPNDNLWIISEKVYGSGRYFRAIAEFNRPTLPRADRLTVGTVIRVPAVSVLEQNFPALCPKQRKSALVKPRTLPASTRQRPSGGNVYVVEEGDTLFDIARYELGRASRWAEIYDLNRETLGEDFDYLQPGTELVMPVRPQSTDSFTRQPDSGVQR